MTQRPFLTEIDAAGTATLTLNRPEVHNAFDDALVLQLTEELRRLEQEPRVRAVVLAANGKSFSAGADLNWMRRMAGFTREENVEDAMQLAGLMQTLNELAKPTLALVQGPAYGGGVGLVACCDIALAGEEAAFCFSEVRLGLVPAVISPYVIEAVGGRAARRYFLTGELIDAREALRLGLVHEVWPQQKLQERAAALLKSLRKGGPQAKTAAKKLIARVVKAPMEEKLIWYTAERIADLRASQEGREGIRAFLEKRRPAWRQDES